MKATSVLAVALMCGLSACAGEKPTRRLEPAARPAPPPRGPDRLVLVDRPLQLQDEQEPFRTKAVFTFDLPARPRRARLLLRFSGVPGALSEDYKMGRFRDRVELNDRYLMDLNTFSRGEDDVVEHTKWISVGMLHRHNKLAFLAGDDGARDRRPDHDEFELRSVVVEFDW